MSKPSGIKRIIAKSIALAALLFLATRAVVTAQPAIAIASVPSYATDGVMQGVVTGVDVSQYQVAPFIYIPGLGWYTKPYFNPSTVSINPDGTFSANVTTGGLDSRATIFCAALVTAGYTPPQADGSNCIPSNLTSTAIAFLERTGPTVQFANRTWDIKDGPVPLGPNMNRFSVLASDVWTDNAGLHLTIHQHNDGYWWCTEVTLLGDHLGYGTYWYHTNSRNDTLDVNVTFGGGFTWDDYGDEVSPDGSTNREIDIGEDSRWGVATDPTTQAVKQPYIVTGNQHRFYLPDLTANAVLTRIMIWKAESIHFITLKGNYSPTNYPAGAVVDDWTYYNDPASGHYVPLPGRERVHFNLWLNKTVNSSAPSNSQPVEVVISDFSFLPNPPTLKIQRAPGQPAQIRLDFEPVLSGYTYTVQYSSDLSSGIWNTLTGATQMDNGETRTVIDSNVTAAKKFYRVLLTSQ